MPTDIVYSSTTWREPSEEYATQLDLPVIQERRLYRDLDIDETFAPDFCDFMVILSVIERTETKITIFET